MAYTTKYRIDSDTLFNKAVRIDIQEDGFGGSITSLSSPDINLSWPDGDRSKEPGMKPSSLAFTVIGDVITAEDFLTTTDTQYKVLFYYSGNLNWAGWLDTSGLQSPLTDAKHTFDLIARDGLHLLQEKKLQNTSDLELWGDYDIKTYISYCLDKTDLGLNFWTWINIYPDGAPVRGAGGDTTGNNDPLAQTYVHNTTFQTGVVKYDNPFLVLQKICASFNLVGFQARGEWHFVYIEDWIRNDGLTGTQWSAAGASIQYLTTQRERLDVGLYQAYKFRDNNALVTWQKIYKSGRINYSFDAPPSLIRNIDLNETTIIGTTPAFFAYGSLDRWSYTGTQPVVYIEWDANSYEENRYIRVTLPTSGTSRFSCATFPCNASDTFTFSFFQNAGVNTRCVHSIKVTDGVTNYYLKSDGKWQTGGSALFNTVPTSYQGLITLSNLRGSDLPNADGIPVTGTMQITLGFDTLSASTGLGFIWGMAFKYDAYVNQNINASGQYFQSENSIVSKLALEEEIYISNSPNRVYQGAMVTVAGVLLKNWKHSGVTESMPFGALIMRGIWKNLYRNFYRLEGNILNVDDSGYLISPLNTLIPDGLPDTEFNIATLSVDVLGEQAEGTFVELLNTSTTDDFDEAGTEIFKYIDAAEREKFVEAKAIRTPPPYQYGVIGFVVDLIVKRKKKKS